MSWVLSESPRSLSKGNLEDRQGGRWPRRSRAVPSRAGWGAAGSGRWRAGPQSPRTGQGDQAAAVGQEGEGRVPSETPEVRGTDASPPRCAHTSGLTRRGMSYAEDEARRPPPPLPPSCGHRRQATRCLPSRATGVGARAAPREEPAPPPHPHPRLARVSTFSQTMRLPPATRLSSPTPRLRTARPRGHLPPPPRGCPCVRRPKPRAAPAGASQPHANAFQPADSTLQTWQPKLFRELHFSHVLCGKR